MLSENTAAPSIAEIVNVIGVEATRTLCDTFGGVSREIGRPAADIVDAIGLDAACALKEYWGRGRIYIPRHAVSREARHAEVKRMRSEGFTAQSIARRLKLSERQVYNIIAAAKASTIGSLPPPSASAPVC